MASLGLLGSSLFGLLASGSFLAAGLLLGRRAPAEDARAAHNGFRAWWFAIALYAFLSGCVLNGLAFFDVTPVRAFVALRTFSVIALCVGLWGLGHSVTFLVTGWKGARAAWAVGAGVVYSIVVWTFAGSAATSVHAGVYDTQLVFSPAPEPALLALVLALLSVPQLLAALAYAAVARRIEDRRARRRAFLVAASLALWFGASVAAAAKVDDPLVLARPLLGIVAAVCVLLAYSPPPAGSIRTRTDERSARVEAFSRRVRDLV